MSGFDNQVYRGKHMFRMIGNYKQKQQGKPDDERRLLPVTHKDNWDKHIIQNVTNEEILTSDRVATGSATANQCNIPGDSRSFLESKGMRIVGSAKQIEHGGLCITVKTHCPFADREHKSNHQYVLFHGANPPVLKCHDNDCRGREQQLEGWNPIPAVSPTPPPQSEMADDSPVDPPSDIDKLVSKDVNDWILSKLDDRYRDQADTIRALVHRVEGPCNRDGHSFVKITNRAGVCYAAIAKGEFHQHGDAEKSQLWLSKGLDEAVCQGKHNNVKLRGRDSPAKNLRAVKQACGLYGSAVGSLSAVPATDGSLAPYEISTTQQMVKDAFDCLYTYAQTEGHQKQGGIIMQINPDCKYDYVSMKDYKAEDMTFEAYYNYVKSKCTKLQAIHDIIPDVRSKIVKDLERDDLGRLPYVHREDCLFAFTNGILCIQATDEEEEGFRVDDEGAVVNGPDLKFFTYAQLESQDVDPFVVRKYFPIEFQVEWMSIDTSWSRDSVIALEQSGCNRFLQTLRDQGFFDNFQDFEVANRQQKWPVAKLVLAFMGRALFKTGTWDDYAFMLWLHGASRYGKTLANFILSQFFQANTVTTVNTQGETTFGKEVLVGKRLIWFTDPKSPGTFGFPMDISELQTLIEGGSTNIPRKNKSQLANVILDGALVADSNKRPNQIWKDDESALLNRMATIPYTREPPERLATYKATGAKNPIIREELGALLCLIIRCYQDLLRHARDTTFIDWKIPMFIEARDTAALQNDPLYRYLTLPKGEVQTKDAILWCEYDASAKAPLRELKRRFLAWMEFDQKQSVAWADVDVEQALRKASNDHEGEMKLSEPAYWYRCNRCKRDVDCNRFKPQLLNDCCEWFRDTPGTKEFKAKRTRCNKVKKKEVSMIHGLRLCEESKAAAVLDRSDFKWNGLCGCGQRASSKNRREDGAKFYHCFFGAFEDAQCSLKWQNAEQLDDIRCTINGRRWPN